MPRIPRVRGLSSLQSAVAPSTSVNRIPFAARAAALSTSSPARIGKNTEWVRGKLWKGEAPGPEDPYTQRPEPVDESNLPEEALEYQPRRDRTPRAIKESRLALPPKRTEAATEEEIQSVDPSYTPATTIDGLEEIEPLKTWWEQPGHWGEESDFRGFGSADKVQDKAVLEVYLRQALVEALSLQEAGLLEGLVAKKWRPSDRSELDQTLAVDLQVQDGKATLKGDVSAVTGRLTSEAEQPEEVAKISVEEAQEIVKAWDASWKTVTLNDHLKFAIRKRLYQLTGRLISDVKLGAARTPHHFLALTINNTKRGKKLAEILEARTELPSLPNVKVHSKRIGPIDREIAVGRWKVIEEELRKRDLPVTGTGGLGKNMERDWLTGKA
ncbi:hypothetical protein NCS57_00376300 [Fusarium keratoplasticum]|uniref:Uncharacterized protein n=1 Tax=Fusarium keratoplasticum TaxID=1328300 RepID=A0ACC0R6S5_9HYPO|nr:hypothetical protein NCS57_00376300 [Fusarium keratoplasticum]KAI8674775.1 hypothetical protein NCS57_00376300 [Fusarium keratoplasticum]KAI8681241.1 hypothetical protein NCS55_00374600 [Fusarium keratoplasticum]